MTDFPERSPKPGPWIGSWAASTGPLTAWWSSKPSESVLVKRLGGRRSCPACGAVYNVHFSPPEREGRCDRCGNDRLIQRADDAAETVRRRLEVYRSETEPLIRYYEEGQAPVDRIDGGRGADEVHAAIAANLAPGREAADPDIGALEIAS